MTEYPLCLLKEVARSSPGLWSMSNPSHTNSTTVVPRQRRSRRLDDTMSTEARLTSDHSPMHKAQSESHPHDAPFSIYGRANGAMLWKIVETLASAYFNTTFIVVVIGIDTWKHVYPAFDRPAFVRIAFVRMYALLTGEPRLVRNALPWLRNLVIPAPANTYHDAVRFLRDTAPNGRLKLPSPPWEVFYEGRHTFAFRPISSLYSVGSISPLASYDVVIRNMFFYQNGGRTTRRMIKKVCDILKSVNYNSSIALFVPDNDTHVYVYRHNPHLSLADV